MKEYDPEGEKLRLQALLKLGYMPTPDGGYEEVSEDLASMTLDEMENGPSPF